MISDKIKQELKEKSKQLEEKVKMLKAKEVEYNRVNIQKEKMSKEVEVIKKECDEQKRRKVELQRKMRDENVHHQREKKELKQSEFQSQRREKQARKSIVRLEGTLTNRERVWKGQLEAKERETNRLRDLVQKQQNVKDMNRLTVSAKVDKGGLSAENSLVVEKISSERVAELRMITDNELLVQSELAAAKDELQTLLQQRGKAAREVHSLRSERHEMNSREIDKKLKLLEEEVRKKSAQISILQGTISDLSLKAAPKKNRFNCISTVKEGRLVSDYLLELSVKSRSREHILEKKVAQLQEQLLQHFSSKPELNTASRKRKGAKFEDSDDEYGELDETFYPSEDEQIAQDSDISFEERTDRNRPKEKREKNILKSQEREVREFNNKELDTSGSVFSSKDISAQESDSEQEEKSLPIKNKAPKRKKMDASTVLEPAEIKYPLAKQNVKELKLYLSSRGLAVSGDQILLLFSFSLYNNYFSFYNFV
jgi:hypothetical protein